MHKNKYNITALIIIAIFLYIALTYYTHDKSSSYTTTSSVSTENTETSFVDKLERKAVTLVSEKKLKAQEAYTRTTNFIGKIVDQNSMPVPGATVNIRVKYYPFVPNLDLSLSTAKFSAITNDEGVFTFEGLSGVSIIIENINKSGYTFNTRNNYYDFTTMSADALAILNNPTEPKLFQAWKLSTLQGTIYKTLDFYIIPNGRKYFVDLEDGNITSDGSRSDLNISASREDMMNGDYSLHSWSINLTVPDGGIIQNNQEFNFMAPESGYQTSWEYKPGNTNSDWTNVLEKLDLFMLLKEGRYANVILSAYPFYGFNHDKYRVVLRFALNEEGNRNFEPPQRH